MFSDRFSGWLKASMLAAMLAAGLALPARAQEALEAADDAQAAAEHAEATEVADANDSDIKDIDVSKLDWSQLDVDASTLAAAKPRAASPAASAGGANWSSTDNPNGASAVSVKQSLSPFWDARVGADMTVAREPTTMSELLAEKTANGGTVPQSSGTAFAAITAPGAGSIWDKTAVEARVDSGADQSTLDTTISKSVPLSGRYSLTLQNGYSLTQQGVVPVPGVAARAGRSYETDQSAKFEIADTGTSLVAGQSLSSTDDRWLHTFGAEQKLSDGVTISGSIGETSQGATSKSITAGFKRSW